MFISQMLYIICYTLPLQVAPTLSPPAADEGADPASIANLSFERNVLPKSLGGVKQRPCGVEGRLVAFTAEVGTGAVLDFISSVANKVCESVCRAKGGSGRGEGEGLCFREAPCSVQWDVCMHML